MTAVEEPAPAKVNLTLHVTGRRADGYHLLDSLVVFAEVGDRITVRPAQAPGFTVEGPEAAGVPTGPENLVLMAAHLMPGSATAITLTKVLPASSGIGGGSADAAATLRALARLRGVPVPGLPEALSLGADVPVCLTGRATRMSGVGERLAPVPDLPPLHAVLVNPRVPVATPAVFAALDNRDNAPMAPLPTGCGAAGLLAWLARQRNDLEPPARALAPPIAEALSALGGQPACRLARMSGSGATCFGLFDEATNAARAADAIRAARPDWWVVATVLS